ncbi:hypothetical protein KHC23_13125 [Ancylobacter dichloromethanicus]|uniref:Uncharacterized protein n=1 Tax=Ancylobacter dichloromethanicus TaxID=518825 RepID=A0A9W6MZ51_9HYPH|nr:hypothetical protein [Ancylobacter dichloromethanicus]MBS7554596.1 hypothetical protein [Ancylobacter dichloromethanicus]GLK71726.1 hypothetical protein GCM10017643_18410 [Ancylobacter dichloromethanicus]
MPDSNEGQVNLPCVLHERIDDVCYVCEVQGWTDLVYLLDLVAHGLQ